MTSRDRQICEKILAEIQAGRDSVRTESDWVSEEDMLAHFGLDAGVSA